MLSRLTRPSTLLARALGTAFYKHATNPISPYFSTHAFKFTSGIKEDSDLSESHDDFKPVVREHDLSDIESQIQKVSLESNTVD